MDFDAVEPGCQCVFCRAAIILDNSWDFAGFERPRCHARLKASFGIGGTLRAYCRRRDRQDTAWLQRWVRHASDMPELNKDVTATAVNGAGYASPCFDLRLAVDPRREGIASPLRGDIGPFRNDQTCRRPLLIIFNHERTRDTVWARTASCQRGHHDAVGQNTRSNLHRLEQVAIVSGKAQVPVPGIIFAAGRPAAKSASRSDTFSLTVSEFASELVPPAFMLNHH